MNLLLHICKNFERADWKLQCAVYVAMIIVSAAAYVAMKEYKLI